MTSPIIKYYDDKKISFIISEIKELQTPPEKIVKNILVKLKELNLA